MEAKDEVRKALRSLPWYLIGGYLFGPLLLAMFTAGASLLLYLFPFSMFDGYPEDLKAGIVSLLLPGLIVWILRQFIRAAAFSWRRNHLAAR